VSRALAASAAAAWAAATSPCRRASFCSNMTFTRSTSCSTNLRAGRGQHAGACRRRRRRRRRCCCCPTQAGCAARGWPTAGAHPPTAGRREQTQKENMHPTRRPTVSWRPSRLWRPARPWSATPAPPAWLCWRPAAPPAAAAPTRLQASARHPRARRRVRRARPHAAESMTDLIMPGSPTPGHTRHGGAEPPVPPRLSRHSSMRGSLEASSARRDCLSASSTAACFSAAASASSAALRASSTSADRSDT